MHIAHANFLAFLKHGKNLKQSEVSEISEIVKRQFRIFKLSIYIGNCVFLWFHPGTIA